MSFTEAIGLTSQSPEMSPKKSPSLNGENPSESALVYVGSNTTLNSANKKRQKVFLAAH